MKPNRTSFNSFRKKIILTIEYKNIYKDTQMGETLIPTGWYDSTITLPTIEDTVFYEVLKTEQLTAGFNILMGEKGVFKGLLVQNGDSRIYVGKIKAEDSINSIGFNYETENGSRAEFLSDGKDWFIWGFTPIAGGISAQQMASDAPYIFMSENASTIQPVVERNFTPWISGINRNLKIQKGWTKQEIIDQLQLTLTAGDVEDGDLTNRIKITFIEPFSNNLGDKITINFSVKDNQLKETTASATFTVIDTIPPIVPRITSHSNNQWIKSLSQTVAGIGETGTTIQMFMDGILFNEGVVVDGIWSFSNVGFQEGSNSITVISTDEAGNQSQYSIIVNVDTIAPEITITSVTDSNGEVVLENSTILKSQTLLFTGLISEANASISCSNGSSVTNNGDGTWTALISNLSLGVNTLTFTARDLANNTDTVSFVIETYVIPDLAISITSVTKNGLPISLGQTISFGDTLEFSGLVNRTDAIIDMNGLSATNNGDGTWSYSYDNSNAGDNLLTFTATDATDPNQTAMVEFSFSTLEEGVGLEFILTSVVDSEGITILNGSQVLFPQTLTFTGTVNDPTATLSVNGQNLANNAGSWSYTYSASETEELSLVFSAIDSFANLSQIPFSLSIIEPISLTVDTITDLQNGFALRSDNTINFGNSLIFTGTISNNATLEVNGNSISSLNGVWTYTHLIDSLNPISLSFVATDTRDNSNTITESFDITPYPLMISIATAVSDDGRNVYNEDAQLLDIISFTGEVNDINATIEIDGTPITNNNGTWTYEFTVSQIQHYDLVFIATDLNGNEASATFAFNVEHRIPTITSHTNLQGLNLTPQTFSGVCEANCSNELFVNGVSAGTFASTIEAWNISGNLTEGDNQIYVVSTFSDTTSLSSETITVVLDTIAPVLTIVNAVSNGASVSNGGSIPSGYSITITGTVSEQYCSISSTLGAVELTGTVWSLTLTPNGQTSYSIDFIATDIVGNQSDVETFTFTISTEIVEVTNAALPMSNPVTGGTYNPLTQTVAPSAVTNPIKIPTSMFGLSSIDARAVTMAIRFKTTGEELNTANSLTVLRFYAANGTTVHGNVIVKMNSISIGSTIFGTATLLTSTNNFLDGNWKKLVIVFDKVWSAGTTYRVYCSIYDETTGAIEHSPFIYYSTVTNSATLPLSTTTVDVGPATLTSSISYQFSHFEIIQNKLASPNQIEDYFSNRTFIQTSLTNITDDRVVILAQEQMEDLSSNNLIQGTDSIDAYGIRTFDGTTRVKYKDGVKFGIRKWSQNHLEGKTFSFSISPNNKVASTNPLFAGSCRAAAIFSFFRDELDGIWNYDRTQGGWIIGVRKVVYNNDTDYRHRLIFCSLPYMNYGGGGGFNGYTDLLERTSGPYQVSNVVKQFDIWETEEFDLFPFNRIALSIEEENKLVSGNYTNITNNIKFYSNGNPLQLFKRIMNSNSELELVSDQPTLYSIWSFNHYSYTVIPEGVFGTAGQHGGENLSFRIGPSLTNDLNFKGKISNFKMWYGALSEVQIIQDYETNGQIEFFTFTAGKYLDDNGNEVIMTSDTNLKTDYIGKTITFVGGATNGKTIEVFRNGSKIGETISSSSIWSFDYTFGSNDDTNLFQFKTLVNGVQETLDFVICQLDVSNKFIEEQIGLRNGNATLEGTNLELNRGSTGLLNYSSNVATFDSIVQRWDPALTNANLSYFSDLPVDLRIPNGGGITYNKQRGNIYSLWIKSNDSGDMPIFDFANYNDTTASNGSGSRLLYTSSTNILKIQNNWDSPYNNYIDINLGTYFPGLVLNDGNWHHIIIQNKIWDTTIPTSTNSERWYRKMDLIIDGVKVNFNRDRPKSIVTATYEIFRSSSRVLIGAYASGITNLSTYAPATSNCSIDQFQILDGYYLNDLQIEFLFRRGREDRTYLKDLLTTPSDPIIIIDENFSVVREGLGQTELAQIIQNNYNFIAIDILDGDISGDIQISFNNYSNVLGDSFETVFTVTNSNGLTTSIVVSTTVSLPSIIIDQVLDFNGNVVNEYDLIESDNGLVFSGHLSSVSVGFGLQFYDGTVIDIDQNGYWSFATSNITKAMYFVPILNGVLYTNYLFKSFFNINTTFIEERNDVTFGANSSLDQYGIANIGTSTGALSNASVLTVNGVGAAGPYRSAIGDFIFTFSAWVKFTTVPTNGAALFADSYRGVAGNTYLLYKTNNQFEVKGISLQYNSILNDGTWKHVVLTQNRNANIIYVNGQAIGSMSVSDFTALNANTELQFGNSSYGTTTPGTVPLGGQMDRIEIFNRVLSQPEIAEKYYFSLKGIISVPIIKVTIRDYYIYSGTSNTDATMLTTDYANIQVFAEAGSTVKIYNNQSVVVYTFVMSNKRFERITLENLQLDSFYSLTATQTINGVESSSSNAQNFWVTPNPANEFQMYMHDKINVAPMFEKYNSSITTSLITGMRSQYSEGNARNIIGTNSVTYLNITQPIDLSNLKEFEFKVSFLDRGNFGLAPINDTALATTINNYQRSKWTCFYNNSALWYRSYSTDISYFAAANGTIFSYKVKRSLLDFAKGNVSVNTWGTLSAPASSATLKYTYASTLQANMNTPVYGTIAMDGSGWQTKLIDTSSVGLPTALTQQQIDGRLLSNASITPTFNSPAYGSTSIINGNASISNDVVNLDGTGDYLNYGSGYNYTGNLTFGAWFKCPSTTQTRIIATSDQVNGKGYSIMTKHNNANNQIFVMSPNGTTSGVTLPYSILDNQWHHIMCVFEANVYFRVYLDGEVVYNTTITGDALYDPKAELIIGGMKNGTTNTVVQTFSGQIGGVVVLNQTLGENNVWNVAYLTKPT